MTIQRDWRRKLLWLFAAGSLIVAPLAGCTESQVSRTDDAEAAWVADTEVAKAKATSEFEREVFADDQITPAEYDEAVRLYVECVNRTIPPEFGAVTARKNEFGMYGYDSPPMPEAQQVSWNRAYEQAHEKCRVGTTALIEPLFVDKIMNPLRLSPDEQIVECLKRKDLVPDSYTVENFKADSGVAAGAEAKPGSYDPDKATGLDLSVTSGPVNGCMVTPWA